MVHDHQNAAQERAEPSQQNAKKIIVLKHYRCPSRSAMTESVEINIINCHQSIHGIHGYAIAGAQDSSKWRLTCPKRMFKDCQ
jgi:hypothetical protein